MKLILGVTGGIAAYKAPELVRQLVKAGHEVQVVMTHSAQKFVAPLALQTVSMRCVRSDLFDQDAESAMGHIELARWAEQILIAPATAHCIAQLSAGLAGNLLTTLCLASTAPLLLAPAMNQQMWQHPATRENMSCLRERGVRFIGPDEGDQACGELGPGRMSEPADIVTAVAGSQDITC